MKANIKKDVNIGERESKLYRLIEMKDAMNQSIDNASNVLSEQKLLIDIIKTTDEPVQKTLETFVKDMSERNEDLTKQIDKLKEREMILEKVIERCQSDKDVEEFVNAFLKVFGVFDE